MAPQYKLHQVVDAMTFPCTGDDVVAEAQRQGLPETFISELRPLISGQNFQNTDQLEQWVANNVTAHMAGLLGGATVHDLIERAKKIA